MTLEIANIGVIAALLAGMISFLSPCVLPLVPGYVSYIAGGRGERALQGRGSTLFQSLCFVLGFSTVFILLGAGATALGGLLLSYRQEANIVGGVIVIVFGVFATGLIRMPWMERDIRYHGAIDGSQPLGAYILGLAFGFGWTPCIGPILGAILTLSATVDGAGSGVALLAIYSMGLGVPFVLTAIFAETLTLRLKRAKKIGRMLQVVAGAVMILMGVAMITGQMSVFAFWLLQKFPIFTTIG
ncbi:cytochrome c biogenesis CcdA family protein [Rhizobium sp.]